MRRLIVEMGMGVDLHGADYTRAACRAVEDAMRHVALPVLSELSGAGVTPSIRISIGAAQPDAVDPEAVARMLPQPGAEIRVSEGGLDVTDPETGARHVTVSAAVEVFFEPQAGRVLRGGGQRTGG